MPRPLAVWDTHQPSWQERWPGTSPWALAHFGEHATRTFRAEFYLVDAPFVVLHTYQADAQGRIPVTPEGLAQVAEPITLLLDELPPEHLRWFAGDPRPDTQAP